MKSLRSEGEITKALMVAYKNIRARPEMKNWSEPYIATLRWVLGARKDHGLKQLIEPLPEVKGMVS